MKSQSGNALFLILIAVALFAALSYAVTSSGRGGGGIDKEQAEILAAQILNDVSRFQHAINRLRIVNGYTQVIFSESAENQSGTCYSGLATQTPCYTIGLFNSDTGVSKPILLDTFEDKSGARNLRWLWESRQIILNGNEVGTDAPDIILIIDQITDPICSAINRMFNSTVTLGTAVGVTGASHGYTALPYDGVFRPPITGPVEALSLSQEGCLNFAGENAAMFIIKEN